MKIVTYTNIIIVEMRAHKLVYANCMRVLCLNVKTFYYVLYVDIIRKGATK